MDATATGKPAAPSAAALAKAAFRRLAQSQLEPTPENYAKAYAQEAGLPPPGPAAPAAPATTGPAPAVLAAAPPPDPAAASALADGKAQAQAWAALVERLPRSLERGGKQWTAARRKDSMNRVFSSSRSDPQRLLQRLQSLLGAWDADVPGDPAHTGAEDPPLEAAPAAPAMAGDWAPVLHSLRSTVDAGLPPREDHARQLADRLSGLADAVAAEGATPPRVAEIEAVCSLVRRVFGHRHHLVENLSALCVELSSGLAELSEDDSWAQGQCRVLQVHLGLDGAGPEPAAAAAAGARDPASPTLPAAAPPAPGLAPSLTVRGVRAARAVLAETRQQQQRVRGQRGTAREALRQLIQTMLLEVGELGEHTGRFQASTARHAQAIAQADTLESLAGVVQALLGDTHTVQTAVTRTQQRLAADQSRAAELEARVRELEGELRRLSEEVATDALTQVANRRGLMQAFDAEVARQDRAGPGADPAQRGLAVGLIDIDNFKRLNDTLGHAAGDQALKHLAAAVRERLRPVDHLARFGGEEFVVLLPATGVEEAQQALTRLQRGLSEALFLHEGREVFVTFSGGVTAWRTGEALQAALERADEALYEAKRTGKNRTCVG
jgi:diguanylate cyclase